MSSRPSPSAIRVQNISSWLAGTSRPAGLPLNPGAVVPYREPVPRTLDPRIRRMHTDTGLDCRGSEAVRSSPAADGEQKIAARRRGLKSRLPTIFRAAIPRSSFTFAPDRRCVGRSRAPTNLPPASRSTSHTGQDCPAHEIQPALAHKPQHSSGSSASDTSKKASGLLVGSRHIATLPRPDSRLARPRWHRYRPPVSTLGPWAPISGRPSTVGWSYIPCLALTNPPGLECSDENALRQKLTFAIILIRESSVQGPKFPVSWRRGLDEGSSRPAFKAAMLHPSVDVSFLAFSVPLDP